MNSYLQRGNDFYLVEAPPKHTDLLPPGCYLLQESMQGPFLEKINSFTLPPKLYGSLSKKAARIIHTFHTRDKATGVLLAGEKGSGKTLLAELIAIELERQNLPTILVNRPIEGSLSKFLSSIPDNAAIIFDEFEKNFKGDSQTVLLTLLDGVFQTKKLFIFTCNKLEKIDSHFLNRPGRIYYNISFFGLEEDFILEYAQDNLKDKSQIDRLLSTLTIFGRINFDMLQAIIEEMNRYNETAAAALKLLNCRAENIYSNYIQAEIAEFIFRGQKVVTSEYIWRGNPFNEEINLEVFDPFKIHEVPGFVPSTPPVNYLCNEYYNKYSRNYRDSSEDRVDPSEGRIDSYEDQDCPKNYKRSSKIYGENPFRNYTAFVETYGLSVCFSAENLVKVDGRSQTFAFEIPEEKTRLVLKKKTENHKFDKYDLPF